MDGKLNSAKLLGGIGSILMLLIFVPAAGWLLALIGFILVVVAVKFIGDEVKDSSIFSNYIIAIVMFIVAVVAFIVILGISAVVILGANFTVLQQLTTPQQGWEFFMDNLLEIIAGIAIALIVSWIFLLLGARYLRSSYRTIAKETNTSIFSTTGTIYFIGAATTIVIVGWFILIIAKIVEIIAFFSLPNTVPVATQQPPATPPPVAP